MKFLAATIFLATLFVASNQQIICEGEKTIQVWVHIWVGDKESERYSTNVIIEEGSSLHDVLSSAQAAQADADGPEFSFTSHHNVVIRFGDHYQDEENNIRWVVFVDDEAPNKHNPPGAHNLAESRNILQHVEDGEHYLFWLKTDNL